MYCSKCGNKCEKEAKFCNKCGNSLIEETTKNSNIANIVVGISSGCFILLIFFIILYIVSFKNDYYFSENTYSDNTQIQEKTQKVNRSAKYTTVIVTDNFYDNVKITGVESAENLISEDSVSQKDKCPSEILEIENEIIEKYGITAVNLCEMDLEFSKELLNVLEKIYNEFPEIRENITNLSITNPTTGNNYIAAFMCSFPFATNDTTDEFPYVIKTQILFNSKYYLNLDKLDREVVASSNAGHFPPNSNKYSPLAHEFGHYISFFTLMKKKNIDSILLVDYDNVTQYSDLISSFSSGEHSKEIIEEAYNNYKNDTNTTLQFDEWRNTISDYAVAKDNSGNYIYDETIAEGFHDYYLNGDEAKDASKYIIEVLKKYLKGE